MLLRGQSRSWSCLSEGGFSIVQDSLNKIQIRRPGAGYARWMVRRCVDHAIEPYLNAPTSEVVNDGCDAIGIS